MAYAYHLRRSSRNQQFYWNLEAGNGQLVGWSGETYIRKSSARAGLDLFRSNASGAPVNDLTLSGAKPRRGRHEFELYKDRSGEYRWRFQASNNQIIAVSGEGYTTKQNCLNGISLVKQNAKAPIRDHTISAAQAY